MNSDVLSLFSFEAVSLVMGICFMPMTSVLLKKFRDGGYAVARVLGMLICGYVVWVMSVAHILPFTVLSCILVTTLLLAIVFCLGLKTGHGIFLLDIKLIVMEEILFFAVFAFLAYLMGFHPAAYGTEKFMDYGFMAAMMRSRFLPAVDPWYSGGGINYYYGGQYYAVYMTKLTFTKIDITYNLFRAFVGANVFMLTFSLVYQMLSDRIKKCVSSDRIAFLSGTGGLISAIAVTFCGNMHYVYYRLFGLLLGEQYAREYWFPDATRYIGYRPETDDKMIHEFPSYSLVLGDLHAHLINLMFVLVFLQILYEYTKTIRSERTEKVTQIFKQPEIWLSGFLLGVFQWCNYWDFIIYLTVLVIVLLFTNLVVFRQKKGRAFILSVLQIICVFGTSMLVALPFNLLFQTMQEGIGIVKTRSMFHQLLILWGLPTGIVLLLVIRVVAEIRNSHQIKQKKLTAIRFLSAAQYADYFAVILGACAIGLVMMPELIFVRDIYGDGNSRTNTMFKLTYQAFTLFGIVAGFAIVSILVLKTSRILKGFVFATLFLLILTLGYFPYSLFQFYPGVPKPAERQGLNATAYLETDPDLCKDASIIRWLNEHVEGQPVIVEASGLSYTAYNRVSAMTGLPTIFGWYTHEQLWRNDSIDRGYLSDCVRYIYSSHDPVQTKSVLDEFDVSYIIVGSREWEAYGEIAEETLKSMGSIIFQDEETNGYIIKVED